MSEAAQQRWVEEEGAMVLTAKRSSTLVLRLIVGLALLGCARVGAAQGTWSVISLPQQPGEVASPAAMAVDPAGNLYVAEGEPAYRILKRDARGNWSVFAPGGRALGQVDYVSALAVDGAGNLYVADTGNNRVQKSTPAP